MCRDFACIFSLSRLNNFFIIRFYSCLARQKRILFFYVLDVDDVFSFATTTSTKTLRLLFYICIFRLISCVCINRVLVSQGWLRERPKWIARDEIHCRRSFENSLRNIILSHSLDIKYILLLCASVHVHRVSVFTQISGERFPFGIVALQELTFATSYNGLYDLPLSNHLVAQPAMWMPTTLLTSSHMCMQNWITECVRRERENKNANGVIVIE